MSDTGCATCSFRAKYDANPSSLLGRLWRWHASVCPGWKSYVKGLPDTDKAELIERYGLPPKKFA
jgi:hypothetical protein